MAQERKRDGGRSRRVCATTVQSTPTPTNININTSIITIATTNVDAIQQQTPPNAVPSTHSKQSATYAQSNTQQ